MALCVPTLNMSTSIIGLSLDDEVAELELHLWPTLPRRAGRLVFRIVYAPARIRVRTITLDVAKIGTAVTLNFFFRPSLTMFETNLFDHWFTQAG